MTTLFAVEEYADNPLELLDVLHFEVLAPHALSKEPLPELAVMAVQSAFAVMVPLLDEELMGDMAVCAILLLLAELLPTGTASGMAVSGAVMALGQLISDFYEESGDE